MLHAEPQRRRPRRARPLGDEGWLDRGVRLGCRRRAHGARALPAAGAEHVRGYLEVATGGGEEEATRDEGRGVDGELLERLEVGVLENCAVRVGPTGWKGKAWRREARRKEVQRAELERSAAAHVRRRTRPGPRSRPEAAAASMYDLRLVRSASPASRSSMFSSSVAIVGVSGVDGGGSAIRAGSRRARSRAPPRTPPAPPGPRPVGVGAAAAGCATVRCGRASVYTRRQVTSPTRLQLQRPSSSHAPLTHSAPRPPALLPAPPAASARASRPAPALSLPHTEPASRVRGGRAQLTRRRPPAPRACT